MAQLIAKHTFGRGTEYRGVLDCLRRWDSSVRLGASTPSGFGKRRGRFGCPVYIHILKEKRTKLDPSGKKGIFVGYSESLKAYIIYFP